MEKWRTAIAHSDSTGIWIRGYDVTALMRGTFTDTIYLLHRGRLPTAGERELLDALLVGVCDHGPGAPSRRPAPRRDWRPPGIASPSRQRLPPAFSRSATITAAPAKAAWCSSM